MLLFDNYIKGGAANVYRLRLHRQGGRHSICDRRRSDRSQRRQLVFGALLNACKSPKQKAPHMYYSKSGELLQSDFYSTNDKFNIVNRPSGRAIGAAK